MSEQFIGAAIKPVADTFDASAMSAGGPGLPRRFRWGTEIVDVARLLKTWRETGPCHHGSKEQYVRKHWFQIADAGGRIMTIYFERQARSRNRTSRWWLYTIDSDVVGAGEFDF